MSTHQNPLPTHTDHGPWWRQSWLWLVIAGPAIVVVAGLTTVWIAASGADTLVTADYYQKGLALKKENPTDTDAPMLPARQARNHAATGGVVKSSIPVASEVKK
jgi:uncharacterized protein